MTFFETFITVISYLKNPQKRKLLKLAFLFKNKVGLEIGGPSSFFKMKSPLPIYLLAKSIDGVNFNTNTLWEGVIKNGNTYNYWKNKRGIQYIDEAIHLKDINESSFDFLLSCHSLEHIANPIKALFEWKRVIQDNGYLVLILPDKQFTFDINRPITTLTHLIEDHDKATPESDNTHFEEVISLTNLSIGGIKMTSEEFTQRTKLNHENRAVHHHVFDLELIKSMLIYAGFSVLHQQAYSKLHLITIAQKTSV